MHCVNKKLQSVSFSLLPTSTLPNVYTEMEHKKKKGDITKQRLLDAAIECFSKNGYDKTSLKELAKVCDMTHVAVLYHFRTKLGLFEAVVDQAVERCHSIVLKNIQKDDNALQRIVKFFEGFLTWSMIYRSEAQTLLLFSYFASINKSLAEKYARVVGTERTKIEEILLAGKREGLFKFKIPSDRLARMLHDTLLGMIATNVAGKLNPVAPKLVKENVLFIIDSICCVSRREND